MHVVFSPGKHHGSSNIERRPSPIFVVDIARKAKNEKDGRTDGRTGSYRLTCNGARPRAVSRLLLLLLFPTRLLLLLPLSPPTLLPALPDISHGRAKFTCEIIWKACKSRFSFSLSNFGRVTSFPDTWRVTISVILYNNHSGVSVSLQQPPRKKKDCNKIFVIFREKKNVLFLKRFRQRCSRSDVPHSTFPSLIHRPQYIIYI